MFRLCRGLARRRIVFALAFSRASLAFAAPAPGALGCLTSEPKGPERAFEDPHPQPYGRAFEQLRTQGYTCTAIDAPGEVWDCFRERQPEHLWAIGLAKTVATVLLGEEDTAETTCISGAKRPVIVVTRGASGPRAIVKAFQWSGSTWQSITLPQGLRQGDVDIDEDGRIEPSRLFYDAAWRPCKGEDCPDSTRNGVIHIEAVGPVLWNGSAFTYNAPVSARALEEQFSNYLTSLQSVEPSEDLNTLAGLGNTAVSAIVVGRILGLPSNPLRLAIHPALRVLDPALRSLVERAFRIPLETLPSSEARVTRLLPATQDFGGRMPAHAGCTAPTPQNHLGWQSPLEGALRIQPGEPEFYHSSLGAIVRLTQESDPMMDSRQAADSDYSATTLVLFDANGRRRMFAGATIESEFICYANGEYPFYFIEVTKPCHFGCYPEQFLLKLTDHGWKDIVLPTFVHIRANDFDNDGNIDLEGELVHVQYRQCTYLACGSSLERAISVKAPYTWNGSRFTLNRPSFRALYQERYSDSLKLIQSKSGTQQSECDDEILQAIGQVIVLGRMLRRPRSEWLAPVDRAMEDATAEECKPGKDEQHDQILGYTPWRGIRARLMSVSVSQL